MLIALHANVLVGICAEPATVIGRVTSFGSTDYIVRFSDSRVRQFQEQYVRLAVAPVVHWGPRLVVDNSARAT